MPPASPTKTSPARPAPAFGADSSAPSESPAATAESPTAPPSAPAAPSTESPTTSKSEPCPAPNSPQHEATSPPVSQAAAGHPLLRALHRLLLGLALLWLLGLAVFQPLSLWVTLPLLVLTALLRRKCPLPWRFLLWLPVIGGIVFFKLLPPPQPAQWQGPWERDPEPTISGDILTVGNLRDFRYRSPDDYDSRYRSARYDLRQLCGVDFAPCHWDGHEFFCHTMLVFNFSDGQHLVVSPETRLPEGEAQNGLAGLYKRYGILYVFGSEDDILALRTNYRHEDLYLYPLNVTPTQARRLLEHIVAIAQQSSARHEAYNTVTDNCSTAIVTLFRPLSDVIPLQYRLLPVNNGRIAELLYRFGGLITRPGESWEQLRQRSYAGYDITPGPGHGYSEALRKRVGLLPAPCGSPEGSEQPAPSATPASDPDRPSSSAPTEPAAQLDASAPTEPSAQPGAPTEETAA